MRNLTTFGLTLALVAAVATDVSAGPLKRRGGGNDCCPQGYASGYGYGGYGYGGSGYGGYGMAYGGPCCDSATGYTYGGYSTPGYWSGQGQPYMTGPGGVTYGATQTGGKEAVIRTTDGQVYTLGADGSYYPAGAGASANLMPGGYGQPSIYGQTYYGQPGMYAQPGMYGQPGIYGQTSYYGQPAVYTYPGRYRGQQYVYPAGGAYPGHYVYPAGGAYPGVVYPGGTYPGGTPPLVMPGTIRPGDPFRHILPPGQEEEENAILNLLPSALQRIPPGEGLQRIQPGDLPPRN